MKTSLKNQKGFTLIEVSVILVLIGMLAAFAIPKFYAMQDAAASKAYAAAMDELNAREKQVWTIAKMGDQTTWDDRLLVFDVIAEGATKLDLGSGYSWATDTAAAGPTELGFKDSARARFTRAVSTTNAPGRWTMLYPIP